MTYETELVPRANAKEPISADDFAAGIEALNQSGVISEMTIMTQGSMADDQYALTFKLKNPDGTDTTDTIDVSVESTTESWGDNENAIRAELDSFDTLKQKPEYSTLPSYILYYDEGYLDIYDNDGQEGGYWGSDRICKYSTTSGGTLYQREIYTMASGSSSPGTWGPRPPPPTVSHWAAEPAAASRMRRRSPVNLNMSRRTSAPLRWSSCGCSSTSSSPTPAKRPEPPIP